AECVGAAGVAVGVELDPALALRAQRNLARWPHARVTAGDGSALAVDRFDAILVNAGATEPLARWLDALGDAARLLIPLTVDLPIPGVGAGHMLLVERAARGFSARFVGPVGIFHCAGARTREGSDRLRRAYAHGDPREVASLRRDPHRADAQCWLHAAGFCLSRLAVGDAV